MSKEFYQKPSIEIIELESDGMLLVGSTKYDRDKSLQGTIDNGLSNMEGENGDEWANWD